MKNKIICNGGNSSGGLIYIMGVIGALIYFLPGQVAFWDVILGILKSLAWPAMLVLDLFKFLQI
ncbi:MAG TPA: hypothetical protein VK153_00685 [Candidatus Paceibacterota bacterium]|nr:hypothetical protein [Candidatus Paceibacterota bacterium]